MDENMSVKFIKCTLRSRTEEVHCRQVVNGDEKVKTHALESVPKNKRIGGQIIGKESAEFGVLFTYAVVFCSLFLD